MASMWSSFTYVLLPPAVVLLLLMTIPFPGLVLNRGIVKFGDLVFSIRIGTLSVFSVITFVSFVVLAAQTYDLQKRYALHADPHIEAHYSADLQKKASRWRSERNWWI
uniref:BAP29/BAP31 transmembrane domain-containing protein n=2 Tax=Phytophthora ramorum TaxID=164328 RepID=H3G6Y1_PHYRM